MTMRMKKAALALLALVMALVVLRFGDTGLVGGPGSGRVSVPNYTANGGLPKWRACLARVKAGTGNCTVMHIGESTTAAFDATWSGTTKDALSAGIPNQLAGILSTYYSIPTMSSSAIGNQIVDGATGSPAAYLAFNTRVTSMGSWGFDANSAHINIGGYAFADSINTGALTYHPTDTVSYPSAQTIQTDNLDVLVYFLSNNLVVKVGSTTICTLITAGLQSCPATLGDNTYSLDCTGVCSIAGVRARNSTVKAVNMVDASFGGALIAQFANVVGAITPWSPDLCIINDLGNDIGVNTPPSNYQASLISVIQGCQQSGDVLVVTGTVGTQSGQKNNIRAAAQAAAAATNSAFWDSAALNSIGGSSPSGAGFDPNTNSNYGWNGSYNGAAIDPPHQSGIGYGIYASFLAQILAQ